MDINYPKICGHRSNVMDIAWNPFDENMIASCSEDCKIMIWEIPDVGLKENLSEPLQDLSGHKKKVGHLQWHPTAEDILASSGFDNVIFIWNVKTGRDVCKVLCMMLYSIIACDNGLYSKCLDFRSSPRHYLLL